MKEFLAVDLGSARVGVARGNTAARLAEPLATVKAADTVKELKRLAAENQAAGIVVGLPRGLAGQETGQTEKIRQWVEQLKKQVKLPFYWQDEALTSHAAELQSAAAGPDAAAAAIILQDFLDTDESDRVTA